MNVCTTISDTDKLIYIYIYIYGDFNARVHVRLDDSEHCIGPYTFRPDENKLHAQSDEAADNRLRFISFCNNFDLDAVNTFFMKPQHKLATFMEVANNYGPPYQRNRYEQLDYCIIQKTHRGKFIDAETDVTCCVHSDHIPLITTLGLGYTYVPPDTHAPTRDYMKCNDRARTRYNASLRLRDSLLDWTFESIVQDIPPLRHRTYLTNSNSNGSLSFPLTL